MDGVSDYFPRKVDECENVPRKGNRSQGVHHRRGSGDADRIGLRAIGEVGWHLSRGCIIRQNKPLKDEIQLQEMRMGMSYRGKMRGPGTGAVANEVRSWS